MTTPLSPAAQKVLLSHAAVRCRQEWSNVNDPPCHPEDLGWEGCKDCLNRPAAAAVLREGADQADAANVPDYIRGDVYWPYRHGRAAATEYFRALAAELEGTVQTVQEVAHD
jgi:hypothetical protein